MGKMGITDICYTREKVFRDEEFLHRDARLMERYTKMALSVTLELNNRVKASEIPSERLAIVLATSTGNKSFIHEFHQVVEEKGYIGINPSKFPNVMLSTMLARAAIEIQAKGPSVPLYIRSDKMHQAVQYASVEIKKGRCDAAMIIFVDESRRCFGLFMENEDNARLRGVNPRFLPVLKA